MEIGRLEEWVSSKIEPAKYSNREIAAGVLDIDAAFGWYSALDSIARHMGITDDQASQLSYYEFYTKIIYLSAINLYNKKLRELPSTI